MFKKVYIMFLLSFVFALAVQASPPGSPYSPGQTLNPSCTPGTANCTVVPSSASGANSDITSLSGLTTPLSFSQGGTGLSTIGSSGQFLKISGSNLPNWESVNLNNIDGTLSFAKGGTGVSAIGAGDLLYAASANFLAPLAISTGLAVESGSLKVKNSELLVDHSQVTNFSSEVDARIGLQKAVATGLATLGADGKIPTEQLSSIAINNTFVVVSSSSLVTLVASIGDIAVVSSSNETYVLQDNPASDINNWILLLTPASVESVNSKTGIINLSTSDIGEGSNLYFTNSRVDDRVNALINDGIGIYKDYNAASGTLTLNINEGNISINNLGGSPLVANKGGTGLSSIASGEIIYGSGTNVYSSLGIGSNGQVLKVSSGLPVWANDADTLFSAGFGLSLSTTTFSVDQAALNLNNFSNVLGISKGGTGQANAADAFNALAPLQTSSAGKFLTTNGTSVSWAAVPGGISDHTLLSNIGTNTHAQLDSHLINYTNPHQVSADQVVPLQTGQSGKFLSTNGSTVSWTAVPGGITDHNLLTNIGSSTHVQLDSHLINYTNPHQVSAAQIGASGIISEINLGSGKIDWARISTSTSSLWDLAVRDYSALSNTPLDDNFHSLSSKEIVESTDELLIYSSTDSAYRKMTRANLVAGLGAGGSSSWSDMTTPTNNLSLSMGNYYSSFNFGATTGANNLFSLSDSLNNNGTGSLFSAITAANSTLNPLAIGAGGVTYLSMDSSGSLVIGTSTSNITIASNGALRLNGGAVVWEDLRVPMEATKNGGANDPTYIQFTSDGAGSRGVYAYSFNANTTDRELFFSVQMPHSWNVGSDIHPHVHWAPSVAGAGNVVWGLECSWNNMNSAIATTTISTVISAAAGSKTHTLSVLPTMAGAGKNISSMITCRVYRDSNNTLDTYNSAAFLMEIDFHYEIDSFGSDGLGTKAE